LHLDASSPLTQNIISFLNGNTCRFEMQDIFLKMKVTRSLDRPWNTKMKRKRSMVVAEMELEWRS